jgi:hypothetical protein
LIPLVVATAAAHPRTRTEAETRVACFGGDEEACDWVLAAASARTVAALEAANRGAEEGGSEVVPWTDPALDLVLRLDRAAVRCRAGELDACPDAVTLAQACVLTHATDPRCHPPATIAPEHSYDPEPPVVGPEGWVLYKASRDPRQAMPGPRALVRGVGAAREVRWLPDPWCELRFAGDGLVGRRGEDCGEVVRLGLDGAVVGAWTVPGGKVVGDRTAWATAGDAGVSAWIGGSVVTAPGDLVGVGSSGVVIRRHVDGGGAKWVLLDAGGEHVLEGTCSVCAGEVRCSEGWMTWQIGPGGARTPMGWAFDPDLDPGRCEPRGLADIPVRPEEPGDVTVIVRGAPGRPVAIRAGGPWYGPEGRTISEARIGADGRAVLRAPADVTWRTVEGRRLWGHGTYVIDLDPVSVATVTVTDSRRRPVAGAVVSSDVAEAITDEAGRATLACPVRFSVVAGDRTGFGVCAAGSATVEANGDRCRVGSGPAVRCADLAGTLPEGVWSARRDDDGVERLEQEWPVVPVLVPDVDPLSRPRPNWLPVGAPVVWESVDGRFCARAEVAGPGVLPLPVTTCVPLEPVRVVDAEGVPSLTPITVETPPEARRHETTTAGETQVHPDLLGRAWLPPGALLGPPGARREGDRVIVPAAPPSPPRRGVPDAPTTRRLLDGVWYDEHGAADFVVLPDDHIVGEEVPTLGRVWAGRAASTDAELVLILVDRDTLWRIGGTGTPKRLRR